MRDQDILFGKATYRLNVYRGNPRDGYYFYSQVSHQQQNSDNKMKI